MWHGLTFTFYVSGCSGMDPHRMVKVGVSRTAHLGLVWYFVVETEGVFRMLDGLGRTFFFYWKSSFIYPICMMVDFSRQ